jgi:hypothetical protein
MIPSTRSITCSPKYVQEAVSLIPVKKKNFFFDLCRQTFKSHINIIKNLERENGYYMYVAGARVKLA